jgi:hypothetical protein
VHHVRYDGIQVEADEGPVFQNRVDRTLDSQPTWDARLTTAGAASRNSSRYEFGIACCTLYYTRL